MKGKTHIKELFNERFFSFIKKTKKRALKK